MNLKVSPEGEGFRPIARTITESASDYPPLSVLDYNVAKNHNWQCRWRHRDPSNLNNVITLRDATGVVYTRSEVSFRKISDGTSKVYMVGEKYLSTDHYLSGKGEGDNEPGFAGGNDDSLRSTVHTMLFNQKTTLQPDGAENTAKVSSVRFGSAHSGGFNMAMCDGSVDFVGFDIDPDVHRLTGNRSDGMVTTE